MKKGTPVAKGGTYEANQVEHADAARRHCGPGDGPCGPASAGEPPHCRVGGHCRTDAEVAGTGRREATCRGPHRAPVEEGESPHEQFIDGRAARATRPRAWAHRRTGDAPGGTPPRRLTNDVRWGEEATAASGVGAVIATSVGTTAPARA